MKSAAQYDARSGAVASRRIVSRKAESGSANGIVVSTELLNIS
jgi:hypothetical protein